MDWIFKMWKDDVVDVLDLNMALEENETPKPVDSSLAKDMTQCEEERLRKKRADMVSDGSVMKD